MLSNLTACSAYFRNFSRRCFCASWCWCGAPFTLATLSFDFVYSTRMRDRSSGLVRHGTLKMKLRCCCTLLLFFPFEDDQLKQAPGLRTTLQPLSSSAGGLPARLTWTEAMPTCSTDALTGVQCTCSMAAPVPGPSREWRSAAPAALAA